MASAQFGGGGPVAPAWQVGLGFLTALTFAGLVLAGFFGSFAALFGHRRLDPGRRKVLRLIGLNWLEPTTTLLVLLLAIRVVPQGPDEEAKSALMVGSVLSTGFAVMMLPAFFTESHEAATRSALRTLKLSAVLRAVSAAVTTGLAQKSFGFPVLDPLVVVVALLGLGVLFWSFVRLGKHATLLTAAEMMKTQPADA